MASPNDFGALLARVEGILGRVEALLPPALPPPDWQATAFRWRKRAGVGHLQAVAHPHAIRLDDLVAIDEQKRAIDANTRQFVAGFPANNVLLTGSRGTGKSSLVKAMLAKYAGRGLRLIEVDKSDLVDLPDIASQIADRTERFVVFCDDLSFDASEAGYKELKAALDGSVAGRADNVLIYATSNRRHLMPEFMRDNLAARHQEDGEVHPAEAVEERVSLSERFGLWLTFYPFRQDDFLDIVAHWLDELGIGRSEHDRAKAEALQFALQRGSRSGRIALQFARDFAGRHLLPTSRTRR